MQRVTSVKFYIFLLSTSGYAAVSKNHDKQHDTSQKFGETTWTSSFKDLSDVWHARGIQVEVLVPQRGFEKISMKALNQ